MCSVNRRVRVQVLTGVPQSGCSQLRTLAMTVSGFDSHISVLSLWEEARDATEQPSRHRTASKVTNRWSRSKY